MLHYNWNDFMISAQFSSEKILVDAVPTNIRNIAIQSQDIEHIEKAFQGEITAASLHTIPQQKKQFRNIWKFYQHLCKCFNQAENGRLNNSNQEQGPISVFREWCYDEGKINKRERMTIKVNLFRQSQQSVEWIIRLKEVYLTTNGLLLKCNTIILNQLDYHKRAQHIYTEQIQQLKSTINAKIDKEVTQFKDSIQIILEKFQSKLEAQRNENGRRQKKGKKSSRRQEIKIEEMKMEECIQQPLKMRRKPNPIICDQPKTEQIMKYEQDQESKRLKVLEDSCPQLKITPFPIQFDQSNPAYHFFSFSNGSVTKIGGFDYPMAFLKNTIPFQGTHGAIVKYVIQKKLKRSCCLEIGIIDENNKSLLHSSVSDNYIFFKFNVSTVCSKVKGQQKRKRHGRLRPLIPGQSVQMRVNLNLGIISWAASYGQIVRVQIPQKLRKMNLQPFVGIFTTGDMVEFQEYPKDQ